VSTPRLRSVDVARYLGVTHQRVTQMVAEGKLPTRRDYLGAFWTASVSSGGPSGSGGGRDRGG
jgi:hypothetical protein